MQVNPELLPAFARLLVCSWREIFFDYDKLTDIEQRYVTREEHKRIVDWLVENKFIYADPKGGYTPVGETS